jgi:predicted TIM-barrel fold metal-dependent hydrolase
MIIDFHTHVFSPRLKNNREEYIARDPLFGLLYSSPRAKLSSADELLASMDEHGIGLSVVANIAWSDHELCRETNDYILESIARYPGRLVGFCMVVLDSSETALKEIERCADNGIKGVGEIRPGRGWLEKMEISGPLIEQVIQKDLVLLTHASEPVGHTYSGKGDITPEVLFPFIARFPDLKLVCAHWGGGLPFYALMPEVKKALNNVYFDSAASPFLYLPEVYSQVSRLVGNEKILFGSDYPLVSPGRILAEIKSVDFPDDSNNKFLSGNAMKLLGIRG